MKRVLSVVATLAGVGIFFAWRFFGASAEIATKNASGHGWDGARPDLLGKFRTALNERFDGMDGAADASMLITECMTQSAITFLNGTDCSYLYNKSTTTEAEHLSSQEACFKKVGYEVKEKELFVNCMKEKFPGDWKMMRTVLIKEFTGVFEKKGIPADKAKVIAVCSVDADIETLNASDCKFLNKEAKSGDDILRTVDECFERPPLQEALNANVKKCAEDSK